METPAYRALLPGRIDGKLPSYLAWRKHRLQLQQTTDNTVITQISPSLNDPADRDAINSLCNAVAEHGFAVYQWSHESADPGRDSRQLHRQLSLQSFDSGVVHDDSGLSMLTDLSGTSQGRFIPYTSKAMGWHTDGYYNTADQSLGCFTLHCINPASSGGALTLLDHQLVLIALMDEQPELVALLTHPQAMMLPANRDDLGHDRPARYSPVFFIRADGSPGAHYTTRTTNIEWRTPETLQAAKEMKTQIENHTEWHHTIRLNTGQGVITRNVLHRRDAYSDDPNAPRKMLRGRYLQSPQPALSSPELRGS